MMVSAAMLPYDLGCPNPAPCFSCEWEAGRLSNATIGRALIAAIAGAYLLGHNDLEMSQTVYAHATVEQPASLFIHDLVTSTIEELIDRWHLTGALDTLILQAQERMEP